MSERPPEEVVWSLTRGALGTRALAIVSELGVPDALATGPRPAAELARELDADPETLHRLLRALASTGVFSEEDPGVFRNTAASELLRSGGWADFAHLFGGAFYRAIADLDASGEPTFPRANGMEFWTWLGAHPDERAAFDRAMEHGSRFSLERLAPVEWRGDELVVDVGGGNGTLLVELLRVQPGLRGIVFDLPETVRDEAALGDSIEFVPGSFLDGVPEGDVYILAAILHSWDDDRGGSILQTIRASGGPGSRLLILENVVQPGNEPAGGKWLDLLLLALSGGKERTEAQWRELLAAGGFEPVRFHEALIEAVPCH